MYVMRSTADLYFGYFGNYTINRPEMNAIVKAFEQHYINTWHIDLFNKCNCSTRFSFLSVITIITLIAIYFIFWLMYVRLKWVSRWLGVIVESALYAVSPDLASLLHFLQLIIPLTHMLIKYIDFRFHRLPNAVWAERFRGSELGFHKSETWDR